MITVRTNGPEMVIKKGMFKPEPILWFNNGMYCVIPKQIVQNVNNNLEMYRKFSSKIQHPVVRITWDQGIPVDPHVGDALMGD